MTSQASAHSLDSVASAEVHVLVNVRHPPRNLILAATACVILLTPGPEVCRVVGVLLSVSFDLYFVFTIIISCMLLCNICVHYNMNILFTLYFLYINISSMLLLNNPSLTRCVQIPVDVSWTAFLKMCNKIDVAAMLRTLNPLKVHKVWHSSLYCIWV